MIIAEGFKPRRQGLCPPSQPPAAVLSSSPPVAVKKSASQSLSALSGANKMIMVSYNRRHNRQHCQVDQSVDLQLPLPLQPLHQLPAPPLLLLHPLLPPHLNIVMRIGGPFLVPSRSGWRNQEMQKYTKRHLQLPDMFLQHVNSGGEGGVVLFYSCVPAHDQLLSTCIDVHDDLYVDDDIDVDVAVDADIDFDVFRSHGEKKCKV